MSHSAFSRTIETAFSHTIVARLRLEDCELLIGAEQGAILLPTRTGERSFQPVSKVPSSQLSEVSESILTALREQRSIELYGIATSAPLRSLSDQAEHYLHGTVYLNQPDSVEDLLQTIFEQFYQVPSDVKPSRAEIQAGLSDRQALILFDHLTLTASEFEQLRQILKQCTFAIASTNRRFPQIDAIEFSTSELDLSSLSEQEHSILELLATVNVLLTVEQVKAIANVANFQRLVDLDLIHVEQEYCILQINYQSSEQWMERSLNYVSNWIRTQPNEVVKARSLLLRTLQWSADQKRWSEVVEIVRSIECEFAIAKLWGSWSKMLRLCLAASWALEDEAIEAWALHQLGTLAFCQEEVTAGYDTLRDALAVRTDLKDQTAIAFTHHNIKQIKALIVPLESEDQSKPHQRQFYWIVGMIFTIAVSVSIGVSILLVQHRDDHKNHSLANLKQLLTGFS